MSDEPATPAADIEVLEGLEPVRRRPGMYIGGTDEKALHHLFAEVIDNSMDEALAGHATWIEVEMEANGYISITDNGRGIPVDPHPKFKSKSALEVIMCTLHAGGKFDSKVYETSGGLHGVGVSVANALSERMEVEVARDQTLWKMAFERGKPKAKLTKAGRAPNRRGTKVRFRPDPQIFGDKAHVPARARFQDGALERPICSAASRSAGTAPRNCSRTSRTFRRRRPSTSPRGSRIIWLKACKARRWSIPTSSPAAPARPARTAPPNGRWRWTVDADGFIQSYCNTIPTPDGGTHESGLRSALLRGLKDHAARIGQEKRAAPVTSEDVMIGAGSMLSVFVREPEFQGQTKDRLATAEAQRIVENAIKDPFDHWLAGNPTQASKLLDFVIDRAEERLRRRSEKDIARKSAVRKLRLPGKLADCTDSARPTAPSSSSSRAIAPAARPSRRATAAPRLCCRCAARSSTSPQPARTSWRRTQQLSDLVQALGCGTGAHYHDKDLRYEKIIIMTDADVDGAHIASLLITFFYRQMPKLIEGGRLYLAVPPLYRLSHGGKIVYARNDKHKDELLKKQFHANAKVEVSRFKGLGEMMAAQLKETTMDPRKRTLLKVMLVEKDKKPTQKSVERLMGTKAEARFEFIQENAEFRQRGA